MIYLWENPINYPRKRFGEYDHHNSPNYLLFSEGRKLNKSEFYSLDHPGMYTKKYCEYPIIKFSLSKKQLLKYDCLPHSASIPLVNPRLKKLLLELAPNDVEFFPAKVICKDGELEGYEILNVTHTIVGIDHENSRYNKVPMPGGSFIYSFLYLTYKPDCMGEHKFARDKEYLGNLLVREDAAQVMDEANITGVCLIRPEDFYRPITAQDIIDANKEE